MNQLPCLLLLHKDILRGTMSHLCYVDIMSLRWTCRLLNSYPQPSFKTIFIQRLYPLLNLDPTKTIQAFFEQEEDYDTSVNDLCDLLRWGTIPQETDQYQKVGDITRQHRYRLCEMLKETESVIAGSFILDCLYNTNFHNDIDLYVHQQSSMRKFMRISGFSWHGTGSAALNIISPSIENLSLVDTNRSEVIQFIPIDLRIRRPERKSTDLGWKRPAMTLGSIRNFINASYDLDICKSCFDGENLYVRSWKKLFERYDYIKCNMRFVTKFYRDTGDDESGIDLEITEHRAEKYRSRGFKIFPHPKTNEIIESIKEAMKTCELGVAAIDMGVINLDRFYFE